MTPEQELLLGDEGGPTGEGRRLREGWTMSVPDYWVCTWPRLEAWEQCRARAIYGRREPFPGEPSGCHGACEQHAEAMGVFEPAPTEERIYPCADCGVMRTKAEGGTVFTCCDDCWDKAHPKPAPAYSREARLRALGFEHDGPSDVNRFAHGSPPASSPVPATPPVEPAPLRDDLNRALAPALNRHSAENGSNTPDFILAEYLHSCLLAFDRTVMARSKWYGRHDCPGQPAPSPPREQASTAPAWLCSNCKTPVSDDGLCFDCEEVTPPEAGQASTVPSPAHDVGFTDEFLRRLSDAASGEESSIATPDPTKPTTPRCRFWCGNRWEERPESHPGLTVFLQRWCSNACRTAGRRLGDDVLSPESTGGGK